MAFPRLFCNIPIVWQGTYKVLNNIKINDRKLKMLSLAISTIGVLVAITAFIYNYANKNFTASSSDVYHQKILQSTQGENSPAISNVNGNVSITVGGQK